MPQLNCHFCQVNCYLQKRHAKIAVCVEEECNFAIVAKSIALYPIKCGTLSKLNAEMCRTTHLMYLALFKPLEGILQNEIHL